MDYCMTPENDDSCDHEFDCFLGKKGCRKCVCACVRAQAGVHGGVGQGCMLLPTLTNATVITDWFWTQMLNMNTFTVTVTQITYNLKKTVPAASITAIKCT